MNYPTPDILSKQPQEGTNKYISVPEYSFELPLPLGYSRSTLDIIEADKNAIRILLSMGYSTQDVSKIGLEAVKRRIPFPIPKQQYPWFMLDADEIIEIMRKTVPTDLKHENFKRGQLGIPPISGVKLKGPTFKQRIKHFFGIK